MSSAEFGHPSQSELDKSFTVLAKPEIPDRGREYQETERSEDGKGQTEKEIIVDEKGLPIFSHESYYIDGTDGGERQLVSDRQQFFNRDEKGRTSEIIGQRLPVGERAGSTWREVHSYEADERSASAIEGEITEGPDQGHRWRTHITRTYVPGKGMMEVHETLIIAQGNNQQKPAEGSGTTVTKYYTDTGEWIGERGVKDTGETFGQGNPPPEGEWENG